MLAAALGTGLTVLGAWLAIDAGEPGKTPRIERRRAPAASGSSRDRTLETLLERAGSADDADRRDELLEQAVALMVEKDPAAALAFLGRSSSPELREELRARLLHDWAERAPEQARAAVLEMEAGPYLSAVYEQVHPSRHPVDEIVHLSNQTPFDLGILHYASDTPYSRRQSLLSKSLSYFGVESTYGCAIAILSRIFAQELDRIGE